MRPLLIWLRLLTLVSAPASSRLGRLHPLASLALLAGSASAALLTPGRYVPEVVVAATVSSVIVRGPRVTAASLTVASPFVLTYALLSLAVQVITHAPSGLNPAWTLTTSLRIITLTLTSTTVASVTSVYDIIRVFSRISPTFAILLTLSLKLAYILSHMLSELLAVYSVNMPGGGLKASALRIKAVATAIAYCSVCFALQMSETLPPILRRFCGERRSLHLRG